MLVLLINSRFKIDFFILNLNSKIFSFHIIFIFYFGNKFLFFSANCLYNIIYLFRIYVEKKAPDDFKNNAPFESSNPKHFSSNFNDRNRMARSKVIFF